MLFTLLIGLMVIGARGGAKLTGVISKQKPSCAWNGDNIINQATSVKFDEGKNDFCHSFFVSLTLLDSVLVKLLLQVL